MVKEIIERNLLNSQYHIAKARAKKIFKNPKNVDLFTITHRDNCIMYLMQYDTIEDSDISIIEFVFSLILENMIVQIVE